MTVSKGSRRHRPTSSTLVNDCWKTDKVTGLAKNTVTPRAAASSTTSPEKEALTITAFVKSFPALIVRKTSNPLIRSILRSNTTKSKSSRFISRTAASPLATVTQLNPRVLKAIAKSSLNPR